MSIGKGHLSAIGGINRKEIEMKRKINKPKIQVEDFPPPPPLMEEEEQTKITYEAEEAAPKNVQQQKDLEDTNETETSSLDVTKDEFDYYYELKNRKLKSETHTQITLRLPKTLNNEINKLGKGMKKGWKQEFITHALEKEVAKLKEIIKQNKE